MRIERLSRLAVPRPVDLHAVDQVVDLLGDVGGVVADALDVLGDEQQVRCRC